MSQSQEKVRTKVRRRAIAFLAAALLFSGALPPLAAESATPTPIRPPPLSREADDELHALAGFSAALLGAAATAWFEWPAGAGSIASISLAAAAGAGKEIADRAGSGSAEASDFWYTLLGASIGVLVMLYADATRIASSRLDAASIYLQLSIACALPVAIALFRSQK